MTTTALVRRALPALALASLTLPALAASMPRAASTEGQLLPERVFVVSTYSSQVVELGVRGDVRHWLVPNLSGPLGGLAFAPDGALYTVNLPKRRLLRLDPRTGADRFVGEFGVRNSLYEGGLAIAPDGRAWFSNMSGGNLNTRLLSVDLVTGQAQPVGPMGGNYDINGLGVRSDGALVGIDRIRNALVLIDPDTAATTLLATVPPEVGGTGGLAMHEGTGYFATGGIATGGTHELWAFDPYLGDSWFVMGLPPEFRDYGISGLAFGGRRQARASGQRLRTR